MAEKAITNEKEKDKSTSAIASKKPASSKSKTTTVVEPELNLDTRITVKNLAGWDVAFARKHDGEGAIFIAKDSCQRLSRNEVQAQINDGNRLFVGVNGDGSHATLYIEDAETRKWVGFEDDDHPQLVFTDNLVKTLFAMPQAEFEKSLPVYIVTRAEKYALIEAIRRLGFNDYKKMVFASNYTGFKI